eukprot:TRINITY_DN3268_c1_g1_i1.p1 TRINITY_DN3268_c1_g1~~TRINITY_DN3268_c1_g1_i1.p1  ORF type:complete len:362 (+),score=56.17 TRINITY_DN3268_c1_g1_i1:87-1088(+)
MPIEKRRRVSRACESCHNMRMRCDGGQPCDRCFRVGRECKPFVPPPRRSAPKRLLDLSAVRNGKLDVKFAKVVDSLSTPSPVSIAQEEKSLQMVFGVGRIVQAIESSVPSKNSAWLMPNEHIFDALSKLSWFLANAPDQKAIFVPRMRALRCAALVHELSHAAGFDPIMFDAMWSMAAPTEQRCNPVTVYGYEDHTHEEQILSVQMPTIHFGNLNGLVRGERPSVCANTHAAQMLRTTVPQLQADMNSAIASRFLLQSLLRCTNDVELCVRLLSEPSNDVIYAYNCRLPTGDGQTLQVVASCKLCFCADGTPQCLTVAFTPVVIKTEQECNVM